MLYVHPFKLSNIFLLFLMFSLIFKLDNVYIILLGRGQKFHSSARIYEWILERTSDSFQRARPSGRVLKSADETSIF